MRWHHLSRFKKPHSEWQSADTILTSYKTLVEDFKQSRPLPLTFSTQWYWVVLDKAHYVLLLSNRHSLIKFLQVVPFDQDLVWYNKIVKPISIGNYGPLSPLMRYMMLRRTKASHLPDIPLTKFDGANYFKDLINLRMTCNHPLGFGDTSQSRQLPTEKPNDMELACGILDHGSPQDWQLRTKLTFLINDLCERKKYNGGKSVIYTQWRSLMDCH
ncbi:uncharacterized protein MELLADRAFT_85374 [Melampsora larici-populina 98AG31]|uniref:Uncharacterized protein n=1 Tax=Melampsora larici-populina (strain 98AG31 / pathotype 3-4-7) TaxID=747676 RepID=F4RIG0_MELLP|nr:uncharacterized protein MELLADRAFT_85374 [Melampsora larici-populina 98AG31]EGG07557.1 hypothetical protein MELLADRAFT_85374 [Melampsora larici-populina 98AG31]